MTANPSTEPHLRLAGVTRLTLGGRGPKDAYVFDPHRLALPSWALAMQGRGPALLVTLDRHLDLVPPSRPTGVPRVSDGIQKLDEYARYSLDVRNVDHVLAAMEAGLLTDALVIARGSPTGALTQGPYVDRDKRPHELIITSTVSKLSEAYGSANASPQAQRAHELLAQAEHILLDVDLDCFTSPSDADPMTVIPWPIDVIRDFLLPPGSEPFWEAVLSRCRGLTFAREPAHCGGLLASNRLFADVCQVLFVELLGTDLP